MGREVTQQGQTTIQMAGPSLRTQILLPLGGYIWPSRTSRGYNQIVGTMENIGLGPATLNVYESVDPVVAGWDLVHTQLVGIGGRHTFAIDIQAENVRVEAVDTGGAATTVVLNANLMPISSQPSTNVVVNVLAQLRTLTSIHHLNAVAAAVGTNAAIEEYSNGLIQIVSGAITSATVRFETSQDGTNWVPTVARNIETGDIANQTELAGATNEAWEISVAGAALLRANITALVPAASSITITSKVTSGSAATLLGTATGAGLIDASVQRVTVATDILVEACDAIGAWAGALAAANLATSLNHVLGTNSLEFDKVAGNVLAYIEHAGIAVDASGFNPSDVLSLAFRLADLTDVVNVFIRLGTDATNYNEWILPVAEIEAAAWQIWTPTIGSQAGFLGNGADLSNIQYVAFGVEFTAVGDLLNDMLVDHIYLRKILNAQLNAEITSHIDSADVNLHEVGGTATAVGAGATDPGTQRVAANTHDGAGTPALDASPLPVEVGDGTNQLIVSVRDLVSVGNGLLKMLEYNAVPPAVADGQLVPAQSGAYGHPEGHQFNRALGSDQVVEQAPFKYDSLPATARVSAVLAAGYDAAPIEIPTGGREWVLYAIGYVRGAALGSISVMVERGVTIGGVDYWPQTSLISSGAVVPGADTTSPIQEEEFDYQSTGAPIDYFCFAIPTYNCHKLRIAGRESSGLAVGTAVIYAILGN